MAQLDNPSSDVVFSAVTAPLVAENISVPQGRKTLIYVVGSADIVYALDEGTGAVVWQKRFPNTLKPRQNASVSCPNTQNATPVIDKAAGIIYVLTSDGKLRPFLQLEPDKPADPWPELPKHYWAVVGKRKFSEFLCTNDTLL